jgi:tetratricopeptide (TPR) repeat protein
MQLFIQRLLKAFKNLFSFTFLIVIIVICLGLLFFNYKKIESFWYVYEGDKYVRIQDYQNAINAYSKALELYPSHLKARYNLGNIYVSYEDYDSAIECYNTVLMYDPNYINARINLGIILAEEKTDYDRAIEEYRRAAEVQIPIINIPFIFKNASYIKKEKSIAYYDMGLAYRDKSLLYKHDSQASREMLMNAAESYKMSLELDPKSYDTQYNLALTEHLLGFYSEALRGYCKSMIIAPLNYEAYYNLAILLRQRGKFSQAAEEFRTAGNLSSIQGDTYKAAFIYEVLNDVSATAIAQHGFESKKVMDRLDTSLGKEAKSINDPETRALTVDELEAVLLKRIKTASVCKAYLENE